MNHQDLICKLKCIKEMGFVETKRLGDTGVGRTFEYLLQVNENNNVSFDIDSLGLELKAQRKLTNSKTTNLCQAPIWFFPLEHIIKKYGKLESQSNRINFYQDLSCETNSCGLKLIFEEDNLLLFDVNENVKIFSIHLEVIKHRYLQKLKNTLFVYADSKTIEGKEFFHFNKFKICKNVNLCLIKDFILNSKIIISTRCHIKSDGTIRDHGIAFRTVKGYYDLMFDTIEEI